MWRVKKFLAWTRRIKTSYSRKKKIPLGYQTKRWSYWKNNHRSWPALIFKANSLQGGEALMAYTEQMLEITCCRYLQGRVYTWVIHPRLCLKSERINHSLKWIPVVVPMNEPSMDWWLIKHMCFCTGVHLTTLDSLCWKSIK